ncbi:MAG: GNAT family N-acetyltransferase [Candidatus Heimdallarchaeota archaeon]
MEEIIIRSMVSQDVNYLLKKGYPFSIDFLRPKKTFKIRFFYLIDRLFGGCPRKRFTLVACPKNRRAIGSITYLSFGSSIWLTGPLFVAPQYRRNQLGFRFVKEANKKLEEMGIQKAYGDVPVDNPSRQIHSKLGAAFLDHTLSADLNKRILPANPEIILERISQKEIDKDTKLILYDSFSDIVSLEMRNFFEKGPESFLSPHNRFFCHTNPQLLKIDEIVAIRKERDCSFAILFSIRASQMRHSDIYLQDPEDAIALVPVISSQATFGPLSSRLFVRSGTLKALKRLQEIFQGLKIQASIDETMVYHFEGS